MGIVWVKEWQIRDRVIFDVMPDDIENKIKQASKDYMNSCEKREMTLKHKYVYILGHNKRETKRKILRRINN